MLTHYSSILDEILKFVERNFFMQTTYVPKKAVKGKKEQ